MGRRDAHVPSRASSRGHGFRSRPRRARRSCHLRYGDYETANGRVPLAVPTDKGRDLKEAARDRFERLYGRRLPLRLLGVELTPLVLLDRQPGLFPDPNEERDRRLEECKAAIRQRFGFTSLLSGSDLFLASRLDRDRQNFRLRTPCLTR